MKKVPVLHSLNKKGDIYKILFQFFSPYSTSLLRWPADLERVMFLWVKF